jgi:hypothetical protein
MPNPFGVTLKKVGPQTGLVFSTGTLNSMMTLKGQGACCAIIADWISTSKKLGRSVKSMNELRPTAAYVVAFAPDDFKNKISADGDIDIMEAYNLSPQEIQHYQPVNFTTLATYLATNQGYLWVRIYNAASTVGHSVGYFVGNSVFEYMDPNVGLYRSASQATFVAHVAAEMATMYPTLTGWSKVYRYA